MVIRHASSYFLSLNPVCYVVSRYAALDKMAVHALPLCMESCCHSCMRYSKQEAMVPMHTLTFEPQVGLNDKLYICLLDAGC